MVPRWAFKVDVDTLVVVVPRWAFKVDCTGQFSLDLAAVCICGLVSLAASNNFVVTMILVGGQLIEVWEGYAWAGHVPTDWIPNLPFLMPLAHYWMRGDRFGHCSAVGWLGPVGTGGRDYLDLLCCSGFGWGHRARESIGGWHGWPTPAVVAAGSGHESAAPFVVANGSAVGGGPVVAHFRDKDHRGMSYSVIQCSFCGFELRIWSYGHGWSSMETTVANRRFHMAQWDALRYITIWGMHSFNHDMAWLTLDLCESYHYNDLSSWWYSPPCQFPGIYTPQRICRGNAAFLTQQIQGSYFILQRLCERDQHNNGNTLKK